MHRRITSVGLVTIMAVGVFHGLPAHALGPVGSWSCNAVSGNFQIPQTLFSTGASPWTFKGFGWATFCDNTSNTGDPVIAAVYKLKGQHPAPNTCPGALAPGYTGGLAVKWIYFKPTGATGSVTTKYGASVTFTMLPCPGPFTSTWTYLSGYPATPTVPLTGTQGPPSCPVAATQCAMPSSTGAFVGFTYSSPGALSVP